MKHTIYNLQQKCTWNTTLAIVSTEKREQHDEQQLRQQRRWKSYTHTHEAFVKGN